MDYSSPAHLQPPLTYPDDVPSTPHESPLKVRRRLKWLVGQSSSPAIEPEPLGESSTVENTTHPDENRDPNVKLATLKKKATHVQSSKKVFNILQPDSKENSQRSTSSLEEDEITLKIEERLRALKLEDSEEEDPEHSRSGTAATDNASETPSEKVNHEITKINTLRNQSIRLSHTEDEYYNKPKRDKKLIQRWHTQTLMFYVPGAGVEKAPVNVRMLHKWRLWLHQSAIYTLSPDISPQLRGFKKSLSHHTPKEYRYSQCSDWRNLKTCMETLSDLLTTTTSIEPSVSHLFKLSVYPQSDLKEFRDCSALYIQVPFSLTFHLIYSLTNIIANETEFVFYDQDFDINKMRDDILGMTFLKRATRVTLKVWFKQGHSPMQPASPQEQHKSRLLEFCQLLFDSSDGKLGDSLIDARYCDNTCGPFEAAPLF